jgi:Fe-S cluster assembly ATP-binding protein
MLEIRDFSFSAGGKDGREILKNISETFDSGKLYALTGPNGGGKSTLAKLLMGMERPDSGAILLDGRDITGLGVSERARLGIGYSFQTSPRFKGIKVRKLLSLALGEGATDGAAGELLYRVGLEPAEYLDRDADGGLSGGEMKRIEIATVLARHLKLAIFDEPEAGIDLWSFRQLAETFREVHERRDLSLLVISHQERILRLADEVLVLAGGRIVSRGSAELFLSGIGARERVAEAAHA